MKKFGYSKINTLNCSNLHQTTTSCVMVHVFPRCNLFKIYIKPQPHRFYALNDRLLQPILTIGFLRYNAEV